MRNLILGAAATVAALGAVPAAADVKAGVDAWSRGDYATAIDQWRPLAIAGDADAQFNLAQAYKLGRGVTLDPALAESWFRKAALQGHVQAQDNTASHCSRPTRRRTRCPGSKSRWRAANRGRNSCSGRCCSTATRCPAITRAPMR